MSGKGDTYECASRSGGGARGCRSASGDGGGKEYGSVVQDIVVVEQRVGETNHKKAYLRGHRSSCFTGMCPDGRKLKKQTAGRS